tara:strand:- start:2411 stop:2629 length:219 start_codon:yes stop_codon:yes gene_type:complete
VNPEYDPGDLLLLGSAKDAEIVTIVDVTRVQKGDTLYALYNYTILRKSGQITDVSCTMLSELARQGVCKKIT